MINTSTQYKTTVAQNGRKWHAKATITLSSGTVLNLTDSDFWEKGLSFEDGTSSQGSFDVGSVVIQDCTIILNNYSEKFSQYDFYGAIIRPQIGLELPDGSTEWIARGVFTVDEPVAIGNIISIVALDNMAKFDKQYNTTLAFPATLSSILQDCCLKCGVSLSSLSLIFTNSDYVVDSKPSDTTTTFREIVSYVAQLAGSFARINNLGELFLNWYNLDEFANESDLDGGNFTDYTSGDTADGGDFSDYSNLPNFDGGLFVYPTLKPANFTNYTARKIGMGDIVVTGVEIVPMDENKSSYTSGTNGYIVKIERNPLVQNNIDVLASELGTKLVGFTFRPMDVTALDDPAIEAGDVAFVVDNKGNTYQTIISNLSYTIGSQEKYTADAETQSKNQSVRFSQSAKAVQEAEQKTDIKLSYYDLQVKQLNNLMTNSFGLFSTEVKQDDGSVIYYMHDKPSLADSQKVWKKTADAYAVSTDGGKTWNAGLTADGDAVMHILSVKGINADWIKVGTLDASKINVTNVNATSITAGKLQSRDGKVYFDLDNSKASVTDLIGLDSKFRVNIGTTSQTFGGSVHTYGALKLYYDNAYIGSINTPNTGMFNVLNFESQGDLDLNAAQNIDITSGNNAAINLQSPDVDIITSNSFTVWCNRSDDCISFMNNTTVKGSIKNDGDIICKGKIYSQGYQVTSDRDKKCNIEPVEISALDKIKDMNFYSYNLKKDDPTVRMATITGYEGTENLPENQGVDISKLDVELPPQVVGEKVNIGIMYDEAPDEIKSNDDNNKGIDLYSQNCLNTKAIQELAIELNSIKEKLAKLKN